MLKRFCTVFTLLFAYSFCVPLMGNEAAKEYFPSTLGSYWVYADQDGNELTRYSVEGEEIAGEMYHAFHYASDLKDWTVYYRYLCPNLYKIGENGVALVVDDEVNKIIQARLKKETDTWKDTLRALAPPQDTGASYDIEVEAQNHLQLLPTPVILNEEWDATEIKAKIKIKVKGGVIAGSDKVVIDFTIMETGIVTGTETVETAAGTFEDCLKVEYRTETTATLNPTPTGTDSPGETVTTIWFASNVGIVKFQQKSDPIFLDMVEDPDHPEFPTSFPSNKEKKIELKKYKIKTADTESGKSDYGFGTILLSNETSKKYFPAAIGSFWTYVDQDGNELTRRAVEDKQIASQTYRSFSCKPSLNNWAGYFHHIHPSLYSGSRMWVKFSTADEVKKAIKARLTEEMETFIRTVKKGIPQDVVNSFYALEVDAQDHFYMLPTSPLALNEEWEAIQIKARIVMNVVSYISIINITIIETRSYKGTETVETPAGTFENCLKIEYKTKTTLAKIHVEGETGPPGESVTTLWLAPNVGIVKFRQEAERPLLSDFNNSETTTQVKTLELKNYEIKSGAVETK